MADLIYVFTSFKFYKKFKGYVIMFICLTLYVILQNVTQS